MGNGGTCAFRTVIKTLPLFFSPHPRERRGGGEKRQENKYLVPLPLRPPPLPSLLLRSHIPPSSSLTNARCKHCFSSLSLASNECVRYYVVVVFFWWGLSPPPIRTKKSFKRSLTPPVSSSFFPTFLCVRRRRLQLSSPSASQPLLSPFLHFGERRCPQVFF